MLVRTAAAVPLVVDLMSLPAGHGVEGHDLSPAQRKAATLARYEFPPQHAMGLFLSGWARAIGPDFTASLEVMEAEFTRGSTLGPLPNYFATLPADGRFQSGRVAEARELVEQTRLGSTVPT
jgi:hypothetical protein